MGTNPQTFGSTASQGASAGLQNGSVFRRIGRTGFCAKSAEFSSKFASKRNGVSPGGLTIGRFCAGRNAAIYGRRSWGAATEPLRYRSSEVVRM